jgi:hypothetical protein
MGPAVSERLMRLSPDRMTKRGHDVESAASIRKWRTAMEHYAGIAGTAFDGRSRRKQSEEPVPLRDMEP